MGLPHQELEVAPTPADAVEAGGSIRTTRIGDVERRERGGCESSILGRVGSWPGRSPPKIERQHPEEADNDGCHNDGRDRAAAEPPSGRQTHERHCAGQEQQTRPTLHASLYKREVCLHRRRILDKLHESFVYGVERADILPSWNV